MSRNSKLHWSFDYDHMSQRPYFAQQLVETLQEYYTNQQDDREPNRSLQRQTCRQVYELLPNFWRGHKGAAGQTDGGYDLRVGNLVLERTRAENSEWHYAVRYVNDTSGEDLQVNFSCADDEYRTLIGEWQVKVQNSAGDLYSQFHCCGRLDEQEDGRSDIRLTVNGLEITTGSVDTSVPLTCNWSLFDVITSLQHDFDNQSTYAEIALLEDLEKLRPCNRVGYLEKCVIDLGQQQEELTGYFLRGVGVVPSYWWVDRFGNVVIVSNTMQTLVVKESHISGGKQR
jgi:hypothetical protein